MKHTYVSEGTYNRQQKVIVYIKKWYSNRKLGKIKRGESPKKQQNSVKGIYIYREKKNFFRLKTTPRCDQ
jgi:hypothetical protein